jgi:hypothetical protein
LSALSSDSPAARSARGLAGLDAVFHGRGQYATLPELRDAEAPFVEPQQGCLAGSEIGMPVGNGGRSRLRLGGPTLPIVLHSSRSTGSGSVALEQQIAGAIRGQGQ